MSNAIAERQRLGVALSRRQHEASIEKLVAPLRQHGAVDISVNDYPTPTRAAKSLARSRYARQVEHALGCARTGDVDREALP
jgi:hypothetical protein